MRKQWLVRDLTMVDSEGNNTTYRLHIVSAFADGPRLRELAIRPFESESANTEYIERCTLKAIGECWLLQK